MGAISCAACGNPMNDEAVVCPHCGTRRADAGGLAGKLSKEEIAALIASEPGPERGVLERLISLHPATGGAGRVADAALTVATLPLVLIGALSSVVARRFRGSRRSLDADLSGPVVALAGCGGLWTLLDIVGLPLEASLAAVCGSLVALAVRRVIRAHSARRPENGPARIEALPTARAITAPAVRSAALPPARAPEPAPPPADQPRMLR